MDRADYRITVKAPDGAVIATCRYWNILATEVPARADAYGRKVMQTRGLTGVPKVRVERLAGETTRPVSIGLF